MTDASVANVPADPAREDKQRRSTAQDVSRHGDGGGASLNRDTPGATAGEKAEGPGATAGLMALLRAHETLVKYFVIGSVASAIDVVLFLVLYNVAGTSALFAHSISVPTSVLFSFFVNTRHNFKTTDYVALRLISFIVVCAIGYVTGYAIIHGAQVAGLDANIGKILSLPVVFVLQYLLNSRITFRKTQKTASPAARKKQGELSG